MARRWPLIWWLRRQPQKLSQPPPSRYRCAGLDKDELLEAVLLAMPDLDGRIEGRRLADIEPNYGEGADVILQSTTAHMYAVRTLGGGGGG